MNYRKMTSADVPVTFEIAIAGREKSFTREGLYVAGITEEFTVNLIDVERAVEGWVCECDNKVVGVSLGNKTSGEIWCIVVLPEYERRGIGSQLYKSVAEWLVSLDWKELWLGVHEAQVNAYNFFKKRGWRDDEMRGPFRIMKKTIS